MLAGPHGEGAGPVSQGAELHLQSFEGSGTVCLSPTPGGERGITEPEDVHEERPGLKISSSRPFIWMTGLYVEDNRTICLQTYELFGG